MVRKNFVYCQILLFLISVLAFFHADFTSAKMCYPKDYSIQIIDETVTQKSESLSIEAVSDPHFKLFINTVKNHVLSKLDSSKLCQENLDSDPIIELVFVRLPLVIFDNKPIPSVPSWDASQSDATCQIDSPWVKMAIRRSESPMVRAVFIWNERQFLIDQALMSGVPRSSIGSRAPINSDVFRQFVNDYKDSVLLPASSEARSAARSSISERLPGEIFWLFSRAWQSTRGSFFGEVKYALNVTLQKAANGYTELTKATVDKCFDSSQQSEHRYESVLDANEFFTIDDRYRIDRLLY